MPPKDTRYAMKWSQAEEYYKRTQLGTSKVPTTTDPSTIAKIGGLKPKTLMAADEVSKVGFKQAAGQAAGIATSAYDLTKIGEKDVVGQVGTVASALGSLGTAASTGGILSGAAAAGGAAGAFLTALTGPVGIGLLVGGSLFSMLGKNRRFGLR